MRTFEKMAKREERRREAMARHDRKLEVCLPSRCVWRLPLSWQPFAFLYGAEGVQMCQFAVL